MGRRRCTGSLQVSRDLAQDSGLSDADCQVLVGLSEAPGRRVRLTELARLMLWSESRLAHQLDRMTQRAQIDATAEAAETVVAHLREITSMAQRPNPGHRSVLP